MNFWAQFCIAFGFGTAIYCIGWVTGYLIGKSHK